MFLQIAYFNIAGLPAIVWGGMTTLLLVLLTAFWGFMSFKNPQKFSFKFHKVWAILAIIAALIHGSLGILSRFF